MKSIFTSAVLLLVFSIASAQQQKLDYSSLLAGRNFTLRNGDSILLVENVLPGKGDAVKLSVKGKKIAGSVTKMANSETVRFNLLTAFKNQPPVAGKLFVNDDESVDFSVGVKGTTTTTKESGPDAMVYTGIAYWDALAIFKAAQSATFNEDSILHFVNLYNANAYTNFSGLKNSNEFFKLAFEEFSPAKRPVPAAEKEKSSDIIDLQSAGGVLGSLSGIDVTQYVQAFADFLRDRIKEELTLAYINEFRKKIQGVKEFEYMLPKTINVFNTGDVFAVPTMGPTYKSAFAEDMANLPENFERMVFSYDKYAPYRNREDFILFMSAYHSIKMSAEKYHPADILRFVDSKYGYKVNDSSANKVRVALSLLNVLSKNLKNIDDDTWIDKSKVSVFNPFVINVFLGLVYEQNRQLLDASFQVQGAPKSLRQLLKHQSVERIFQFVTLANNIEQRIKEYKAVVGDQLSAEDKKQAVIAYFVSNADDFFNLFDFGGSVITDYSSTPEFYKYKEIVKNTIAVAKGVKTNNLAQVGVNIIALVKQITNSSNEDVTIQQLTNYVNFITDMVYADSARQIKQVLQNYAAPPRSYRAIRQSARTVSLASFPGVYVGYESHSPSTSQQQGNGVFGITAPIGVSVAWGNSMTSASSFAVYLSLVDIGAALTYRWSNDTDDLPQKVTLGQIFSPGLFGVYGFKNSPLALKFGTQYLPQLRSIKQGANVVEANAWHFSAALCVDIPILVLSRTK
ncbi:MAG: hypothetical protein Q7T76_04330 [Ferruginibacter sp.]|nr:hypothetical protein [Ferruginibacter sp.]